jgi:hypothetical protein
MLNLRDERAKLLGLESFENRKHHDRLHGGKAI